MSRRGKVSTEKKVELVEKYLCGEIGYTQAAKEAGVSDKAVQLWLTKYKSDGPTALLIPSKNKHYSTETKLLAVNAYLNDEGSLIGICQKYHISSTKQLRDWIKVYNAHKDFKITSGGSRMSNTRQTTPEERLEIVQDCLANARNYGAIALKYNVSYQQVRNWTLKYEKMGSAGLEDRRGNRAGTQSSRTPEEELRDRIAELERRNKDLQMENDLLKKVRELAMKDRCH